MIDGAGATAREACRSLVNHYSDPVHYSSLPSDGSDADGLQQSNTNHAQNLDESAPYFDSILGGPVPVLAPVCRFWYHRLLDVTAQADNNENSSLDAARELLCCYESMIHPRIKRQRAPYVDGNDESKLEKEVPFNAKVEIIRNYELLVAHFMRNASTESSTKEISLKRERRNLVEEISDASTGGNCVNHTEEDIFSSQSIDEKSLELDACKKMVYVIADDVFQWSTRLPKKDKPAQWKVNNVLLPSFLRLIEHCVVLLTSHNNDSISLSNKQVQEGLAIATVAAVPFVGDGKLKSGAFGIGSLLEWVFESSNEDGHVGASTPSILSLTYTLRSCSLPPISKTEESSANYTLPDSIVSSNFMTSPVVDWSVPAAQFNAPWTDGVTGIGSRVAMDLLRTIQHCSSCVVSSSTEIAKVNNCPATILVVLRNISQNIGIDLLVSTIRAHFFGRLSHSCSFDVNAIVQPQASGVFMPMVSRIGSNNKKRSTDVAVSSDEKPHIDIPMRLSAGAIILCASLPQTCNNVETRDEAFSDALPIALSLLDDVQSFNQATGALLLISVMEAASSFELESSPSFVEKFRSLVTSSLESAIRMCGRGEPAVLTIVCLAQSKWIRYLGLQSYSPDAVLSPSDVCAIARKAVCGVLFAICKQAQTGGRDGNDERIAGALVAGINPLLAQLADFPEAASVEIARVGLSAMLPVVGWSGMRLETRSAQISALAGLVSLMTGAYPIMTHHGKKIMTEVFLLLDRTDKDAVFLSNNETTDGENHDDKVSTDAMSKVALFAAAVSVAICGKSAHTVLEHVESTRSSRKLLLSRCLEIRDTSEQLRRIVH